MNERRCGWRADRLVRRPGAEKQRRRSSARLPPAHRGALRARAQQLQRVDRRPDVLRADGDGHDRGTGLLSAGHGHALPLARTRSDAPVVTLMHSTRDRRSIRTPRDVLTHSSTSVSVATALCVRADTGCHHGARRLGTKIATERERVRAARRGNPRRRASDARIRRRAPVSAVLDAPANTACAAPASSSSAVTCGGGAE